MTKQQQWKEIKRDHLDKIVLFQSDNTYITYHDDATIVAKVVGDLGPTWLDPALIWFRFRKKKFNRYLKLLLDAGYSVLVCEQATSAPKNAAIKRVVT